MGPGTQHQIILVVGYVLRFRSLVAVDRAPHIFLVPQALQPHSRNLQGLGRYGLIESVSLPVSIVCPMRGNLTPEGQLFQASVAREIAGRSPGEEIGVIVVALAG